MTYLDTVPVKLSATAKLGTQSQSTRNPARMFTHSRATALAGDEVDTCPDICGLKHNGCYAMGTGFRMRAVNQRGARLIDSAPSFGPIRYPGDTTRINVAGDLGVPGTPNVPDIDWMRALVREISHQRKVTGLARWQSPVYLYSHGWPLWHPAIMQSGLREHVTVLASAELSQVSNARALGYPVAVVVDADTPGTYVDTPDGRLLVCPAITRGTRCVDCRVCFLPENFTRNYVGVAFPRHR